MRIVERIKNLFDNRSGYLDLGDSYERSDTIVSKKDLIEHFFK